MAKGIKVLKTFKDALKLLTDRPVLFVPALAMAILNIIYYFNYPGTPAMPISIWEFIIPRILLTIAIVLVGIFVSAVLIRAVYESRKRLSWASVMKVVAMSLPALVGSQILLSAIVVAMIVPLYLSILIGLPYVMLLVFAIVLPILIYVSVRLGLINYAIVIDGKGVIGSLKHSWKITDGNVIELILLGLVMGLLYAPLIIAAYAVGITSVFIGAYWIYTVFYIVFMPLVSSLIGTASAASFTLAYLKVRK